ncbi:MAG TPA: hypothetical protein VIT20_06985 [Propionibacteriaceae bacterium]
MTIEAAAWHLAQVNIALPVEPLDSDRLRDFVDRGPGPVAFTFRRPYAPPGPAVRESDADCDLVLMADL